MLTAHRAADHPLADELRRFIRNPLFPCVGAKSALAKQQLEIHVARSIASSWNDLAIYQALLKFSAKRRPANVFTSFAVIFEGPRTLDERTFEGKLWERVQSLSDKDRWLGQRYDKTVSPDPENPHFSLSFGGRGFFVVGLHPGASRKARRFRAPTLIFNLHEQFEKLRADQRYEKMRETILDRDMSYSGSLNPMLARHGSTSEARQYSGRAVGDEWRCPFAYKGNWCAMPHEIAPRSGVAFKMAKGQQLTVSDPRGQQVADLLAYNRDDVREVISAGRTLDYASRLYLTTGDPLYSNRSQVMLTIVEDDVGRHDFLLTPCSADTFRIIYGDTDPHRGCFGNLAAALGPYGVTPDMIPTAFNCFMNVPVDGATGTFTVEPPLSKAGDRIVFEAAMDLVIGLTACSALQSNGGSFKPIEWEVH